jgi:hypothetical protein
MRLFRRKSDSSDHQEYLSDLITSIRQARREELEQLEEKPGLHSFVEDDFYPGGGKSATPARVPPGVAKGGGGLPAEDPPSDDVEAVADLEAYLSALNAAEEAAGEEEDSEERQAQ